MNEGFLVRTVLAFSTGQAPFVAQRDLKAWNQECGLAGAGHKFLVGELCVLREDLTVSPVANPSTRHSPLGFAHNRERGVLNKRHELRLRRGSGLCVMEDSWLTTPEGHRVDLR